MSTKEHVAVRLDQETLARIDAIRPLLTSEWRDATRSDVLRSLLLAGLVAYEKEHAVELGAPPRSRGSVEASGQPTKHERRGHADRGGRGR